MATVVFYDKPGFHDGVSGAWFKGRNWGQSRSRRLFMSYQSLHGALAKHPELANNPNGAWVYNRSDSEGTKFNFFTREIYKALESCAAVSLRRLYWEADHHKSRALKFHSVDPGPEKMAIFSNDETFTALSLKNIKKAVGPDISKNLNPEKIEFYFKKAVGDGLFYSGRVLCDAGLALTSTSSPAVSVPHASPV